jgi:glycosyltransferase involved in cell wall biosynthesis
MEGLLRICFFILNPFDYDSRARFICEDILASGWELDIIATVGGELKSFGRANIHRLSQSIKPVRQRRFIEYNIRAVSIAKTTKADIYHAVDLDTLWAAAKAAKVSGSRVVYEASELYVELLSLYKRPLVKAFWSLLEKRLINKADAVVTINESIANELVKRYGIKKPEIVMNVAKLPKIIKPVDLRQRFNLNSKFVLIYQGILRPGQGTVRALKAVARLPEVSLVFVGDGPFRSEIERCSVELGLKGRVRFAGMVAPDQLLNYTAGANAGLLLMEPESLNNYFTLPQKFFQYIAAGTPPIAADRPELRRLVRNDNLGLVLKDGATQDDVRAIDDFLQNGLESASQACHIAKNKYRWEKEGKKLLEIYRELGK